MKWSNKLSLIALARSKQLSDLTLTIDYYVLHLHVPEKVEERKILTSVGGFGGRLSLRPSSMRSNFSTIVWISGSTVRK